MNVIIASLNPVKITAVQTAFNKAWPTATIQCIGIAAESGVSDQPMSNEETLLGAKNRSDFVKNAEPKADFWVGIEGGLQPAGNKLEVGSWAYIQNNQQSSQGKTGAFFLPDGITKLIKAGKELGVATDEFFALHNTKHGAGLVGVLTNNLIDRTHFYTDAVTLALIPFMNEELFA